MEAAYGRLSCKKLLTHIIAVYITFDTNERETPAMPEVKLCAPAEDRDLIDQIVNRAADLQMLEPLYDDGRVSAAMDITAVHLNGNPLRLADLLAAEPFDFAHDLVGIFVNLDRRTGKLMNGFLPRYSA